MDDLDRELESELRRVLDPISWVEIPPRRGLTHGAPVKRLLGGAGGALAIKILSGVAVAAGAATLATAASTGTLNPSQWPQGIGQKVETCRASLPEGSVGQCVRAIARPPAANASNDESRHGNPGGSSNPHHNDNSQTGSNAQGRGHDKARGNPPSPAASPPDKAGK